MSNRAWVTLATNDSYGLGALVLAHSLRRANSAYPAVILVTPSVTDAMRNRLSAVFAEVITVDVLDSRDAAHLALLQRPELGITFTKIHCWTLTQYQKCVFLDADTLIVQNCDELFEREELSAAPDVGWPDCFNSGVFVFVPSNETYTRLITFAQERGSFDGGDQGLLNAFFSGWARGDINKHLPFLYNVTSAAFYSYIPALKHYGQDLKIIHFIGAAKPWLQQFNWDSRTVEAPEHLRQFLQIWWDLFVGEIHSNLDTTMSGVAGNLARVTPGAGGYPREAIDELTRRQGWEAGNIDYMGADSFDNIWAKISQTLSAPKQPSPPKEPSPPKVQPQSEAAAAPETPTSQEPAPAAQEAPAPLALAPEAAAPAALAPESPAPAPVTPVPESPAPAPVTPAPESSAPAPVAPAPEVPAPEVPAPAAPSPEAPAPAPVATAPEVPKPAPVVPDVPAQETPAPTAAVTEAPAPFEPAPEIPTAETVQVLTPVEASKTESASAEQLESIPAEVPKTVEEVLASEPVPAEAPKEEAKDKTEPTVPPTPPATPKSTPEASTPVTEAPEPVIVTQSQSASDAPKTVVAAPETPKTAEPVSAAPISPAPASEAPSQVEATPEKAQDTSAATAASTDSPPLANTPSKEDAPASPAAKSEERRKPVEKLQLSPPAGVDALPTPDSELEDAAALAQSIIASELSASVTAPSPAADVTTPPAPAQAPALQQSQLSVEPPEVPTPPVSLAQIGVKSKGKPTTAAQIESSVTEQADASSPLADTPATQSPTAAEPTAPLPAEPVSPTPAEPVAPAATEPASPTTPQPSAASDQPKKKVVKKGAKKDAKEGSSGDAATPVPPPRKKEKKPKEK